MYKEIVLYGNPVDPAAFDEYYETIHIPIAKKMRGLTGWTISKLDPGADGAPPPYYLVAELYAPTREALLAVFASPEGQAAIADVPKFATGGATFLFGTVQTITPVQVDSE
ncbi:MAG TPA: EthD family reductase [Mycobacteriales bacterium]|nr:EthD family reductase [Mycobacteriales bacterium]